MSEGVCPAFRIKCWGGLREAQHDDKEGVICCCSFSASVLRARDPRVVRQRPSFHKASAVFRPAQACLS